MPPTSRPQVISISPASAAHGPGDGASAPPFEAPRWVQALVTLLLIALIVGAVAIAGALALAHARDRHWINIASGSWIALGWHAEHGALYPPLRDDAGNFGGTRYMPLHILLHAGLRHAIGSRASNAEAWLVSGRAIAFASALAWALAIIALARLRGCPYVMAGALAACVVASPTGVQALCTIRSDGLALAMQLWALWIISRRTGPAAGAIAGVLCALAFLAKLTAVWAALAIGLWLLWRNRTSLVAFVATGALVAGGGLLMLNMTTDGRLVENLLHSGATGWQGWGSVITWSQRRMLGFVSEWSPTTWMLVPPAALAVLLAAARRDLNVLHIAWVACCGVLAVMFADIGVGENHILELAAITAVVAGDLWSRAGAVQDSTTPGDDAPSVVRLPWTVAQLLIACAVGWSSQAVIKQRLWQDISRAVSAIRSGQPEPSDDPHALDNLLAGKRFFSDDPTLAVLLDQKPVISDAFIFRGFEQSHREWIDEFMARIAAREFDVIALTYEADPDSWWYRELFLGPDVTKAIQQHYAQTESIGGYVIYRPRE